MHILAVVYRLWRITVFLNLENFYFAYKVFIISCDVLSAGIKDELRHIAPTICYSVIWERQISKPAIIVC